MSSKCNTQGRKEFCGREPTEALSRAVVDEIDDLLQLLIRDREEVAAFGEEEANEAVCVFVGTALPRLVRFGEIDRGVQERFQLSKVSEFRAVVERNAVDRHAMQGIEAGV